jgi:hypothetical protein
LPASPNIWSVAGTAGQRIVAGATEQQVIARATQQGVVACTAQQLLVARSAGDGVVAGPAVEHDAHGAGLHGTGVDGVVAVAAADRQHVAHRPAFRAADDRLRCQTEDGRRTATGHDLNLVVAAVPVTVTLSTAPSPMPVPGTALRSILTCVALVPFRSPTVMVSAAPGP